eukprot:CAMPEP_0177685528 /NCGR_PEP_ID=MMETSP0447-20121125/33084_1 /TAXON_ID=0 /ORGANISM="Stygamoeba regulata, Strain BSH-02190019" /LENGTH=629 /DNA_ID=CAMNT_0019195591 /DNA_START=51 /DNA_END=1936 /DNA_ORIENTATION=+
MDFFWPVSQTNAADTQPPHQPAEPAPASTGPPAPDADPTSASPVPPTGQPHAEHQQPSSRQDPASTTSAFRNEPPPPGSTPQHPALVNGLPFTFPAPSASPTTHSSTTRSSSGVPPSTAPPGPSPVVWPSPGGPFQPPAPFGAPYPPYIPYEYHVRTINQLMARLDMLERHVRPSTPAPPSFSPITPVHDGSGENSTPPSSNGGCPPSHPPPTDIAGVSPMDPPVPPSTCPSTTPFAGSQSFGPNGDPKPRHKPLFDKFTGQSDKLILWMQKIRQWVMEWDPSFTFLLDTPNPPVSHLWHDQQISNTIFKMLDGAPFQELYQLNTQALTTTKRPLTSHALLQHLRTKYNPRSADRCKALYAELLQLRANKGWGRDKFFKFFQEMEEKIQLLRDQEEPISVLRHSQLLLDALPSSDLWDSFRRHVELQSNFGADAGIADIHHLQQSIVAEAERQRLRKPAKQTQLALLTAASTGQRGGKHGGSQRDHDTVPAQSASDPCRYCNRGKHLDKNCQQSAKDLIEQKWHPKSNPCWHPSRHVIRQVQRSMKKGTRSPKNDKSSKDDKTPKDDSSTKTISFVDEQIVTTPASRSCILDSADHMALVTDTQTPDDCSPNDIHLIVDSAANVTILNR